VFIIEVLMPTIPTSIFASPVGIYPHPTVVIRGVFNACCGIFPARFAIWGEEAEEDSCESDRGAPKIDIDPDLEDDDAVDDDGLDDDGLIDEGLENEDEDDDIDEVIEQYMFGDTE